VWSISGQCGAVLGVSGAGFDTICDHDEVFQALVLARLIEPTSKLATIRVLRRSGSPL
jgi:hypothetical protein